MQVALLRERREDVPVLAEFFLQRLTSRLSRRFAGIEPESMDRLTGVPASTLESKIKRYSIDKLRYRGMSGEAL